MTNSSKKSN